MSGNPKDTEWKTGNIDLQVECLNHDVRAVVIIENDGS